MFDHYPQYEYHLAQIQLVLFMLGMGATLHPGDFLRIFREPRFLLVGAACQFLLTPLWAILVSRWFGLEPGIAVGLILVAAMPGGTLSKVFAWLAHGNIALTITLSVFGTFASIATVPLLLGVLARDYVPEGFQMPVGAIVHDVALYLLLPLAVGMTLGQRFPRQRHVISKLCLRIGFVFVALMIVGSLASGRIRPTEYGWRTPLGIIAFCLLAQQSSLLPFRLFGWPQTDCVAVGIEVTMRNLNLALLLKALLFPAERGVDRIADGVLFVILYYAGVALGCGTPLALRYRWMAKRAQRRKAAELAAATPSS